VLELAEMQEAIVDLLRPRTQRLAARHADFVALVVRRFVEGLPNGVPESPFASESDRDDFVAGISLDLADQPVGGLGPFWLVVLLNVLLPALIRALLQWWRESAQHRRIVTELRDRLIATPAPSVAAGGWPGKG
jgi:hypothetical protein